MSLTIAPSPFGSLVVSVAETGSTLSVTTVATSPSVLTMALGVPGPAGEAGEPGANGVGVPVGGTAGQVLAKIDGTNYNTEWVDSGAAGDYLPLSGGTMSGTIFLPSLRNLLNTDLTVTAYNDTGAGTNFVHTFDAFDGTFALATNGGGLKFPDETVQVTAGLPLTGGTMSGNITISSFPEAPRFLTLSYDGLGSGGDQNSFELNEVRGLTWYGGGDGYMGYKPTQIIFPDNSVQQTAALPLTGGSVTGVITIEGGAVNSLDIIDGGGIRFGADDSYQTTAFPPSGGLVTEYITGTGTLVTFPEVGDRYLTSSTSTLTCDSGNNKTMTVGTGLSYSRQQDITVSYSNAIHMHGTVLTYDSATGVMTFDSNTHSGSGTYSNWEVNVGGVAGAILPVGGTTGQVLAKINSTNFNTEWISLGTMSTEPATAYLSTASAVANYLTISNAASTYLTQSSASSTYIAQASFATSTQAQAGTSTTTVVNPSTLLDAKVFAGYKPLSMVYTWTSSVSGVGASTTVSGQTKNVFGPTTAIGSAIAYIFNYNSSRSQQSASGADFTKRTTIGGRFIKTTTTADANTVFRFLLGKSIPSPTAGDLSVRGIGFRQVANGALELQVHNGTTLYNVTSSFTPTANQSYDVVIVADAGTATMFVNGSSVATSANAPTALLGTNTGILEVETQNTAIITGSALNYSSSDMFVQTNL